MQSDTDRLDELLRSLTVEQIRYVVARQQHTSNRAAAAAVGLREERIYHWENWPSVEEAVKLMAIDGAHVAMELFRRALPEAAAVKVAGLRSNNERIRQETATEILDRKLGKATQPIDANMTAKVNLIWDVPIPPPQK